MIAVEAIGAREGDHVGALNGSLFWHGAIGPDVRSGGQRGEIAVYGKLIQQIHKGSPGGVDQLQPQGASLGEDFLVHRCGNSENRPETQKHEVCLGSMVSETELVGQCCKPRSD